MTYDVDYFIKKFEAIPESEWITDNYHLDGRSCAFGHCGVRENSPHILYGGEADCLATLFGEVRLFTIDVNDGDDPKYQQPTAKQRILAALYDIKRLQAPQYENISKSLATIPIQQDCPDVMIVEQSAQRSVATEAT